MTRLEMTYQVHLITPLHIGTGMGFAKMVDDMVVRAGSAKAEGVRLPYLPGSSIKGKVRSRCEAFANTMELKICGERKCKRNPCIICRLFGSPYLAGTLQFFDALLVESWLSVGSLLGRESTANLESSDPFMLTTVRTGNKSERATRTVEFDFLFSKEHAADGLQYSGSIAGGIDARTVQGVNVKLPLEGWLLVVGLQAVDKIGGMRSRGLGRCRIAVKELKVEGTDLTTDLNTLLAEEDYLLGLSEYEAKA